MFHKISQNSQEKTCARVSFLIKLQAWGWKRDFGTGFSCGFCEISKKIFFTEPLQETASWLTLHKMDSLAGIWILRNFLQQLFWRASFANCLCIKQSIMNISRTKHKELKLPKTDYFKTAVEKGIIETESFWYTPKPILTNRRIIATLLKVQLMLKSK